MPERRGDNRFCWKTAVERMVPDPDKMMGWFSERIISQRKRNNIKFTMPKDDIDKCLEIE